MVSALFLNNCNLYSPCSCFSCLNVFGITILNSIVYILRICRSRKVSTMTLMSCMLTRRLVVKSQVFNNWVCSTFCCWYHNSTPFCRWLLNCDNWKGKQYIWTNINGTCKLYLWRYKRFYTSIKNLCTGNHIIRLIIVYKIINIKKYLSKQNIIFIPDKILSCSNPQ